MSRLSILTLVLVALVAFGLVNIASAHTGINNAVETTSRQNYVYSNINAPCNVVGWNATNPASDLMGDADGDAICDGWELATGLLIDFTAPSNYTGGGAPHRFTYSFLCGQSPGQDPQCPSRDKKDVYLELNWMKDPNNSHVPAAGVVQAVIDAYANAPVSNPNGQPGIRLHVQYGEWPASATASRQGDIKWHKDSLTTNWSATNNTSLLGFYRMKQYTFGTVCERFADTTCPADTGTSLHKNANYQSNLVRDPLTAKFQVFHYLMIINKRTEQTTSSGWGEVYGNDHVWSLGSFTPVMGNVEQQKGTFVHELGHNFNLTHGGVNDIVNNPNYLSVMNFPFQYVYPDGKDLCRPLDYSNQELLSLAEAGGLGESAGINNAAGTGYLYPSAPWSCSKTWTGNAAGASLADQTTPVNVAGTQRFFWYSTPGSTTLNAFDRTNQAVNWNNDVPIDDNDPGLTQSINADSPTETLYSANDWNRLKFDFGSSTWSRGPAADEALVAILDPDAPADPLTDINCENILDFAPDEVPVVRDLFTTGCQEITVEDIQAFRTEAVDGFNQILLEEAERSPAASESSSMVTTAVESEDLKTTIKTLLKLGEDLKQGNIQVADKDRVLGSLYNILEGFEQAYITGTKVKSGQCKDGFEQIISFRDGKIACVKQGNAEKLKNLGWGFQLESQKLSAR